VTRRASAFLVCALLLASGRAEARTWTVGGAGADFPLIAPAIHAASEGDTVVVRRGVYREDLVIERTIALVGQDWPVLIGTGAGTVIEIRASGSEVRGFVIEGSGVGLTNQMDAAVHLMGDGNRVAANVMRRVFYGVVIIGAVNNEVADNTIEGLADLAFGRRGDGVYVFRAPDSRVLRNRIGGMRDGIYFQYAPRGVAEGNVVERSRYGLHDMFSDEARIETNTFRDSSVGATVMNSAAVTIRGNRIERNRGVSSVGLSIKQCDGSLIEDNLIVGNARGVLIDGASENRFVANRFLFNDTAVTLFSSAERNVFTANRFEENWSDVIVTGRGSDTRWSENGRGNRWSRYRGFDFDGDGIGDGPHPFLGPFEKLEGHQPATRLFLQSPAALALELAAGAGIAARGDAMDPAPLSGSDPPDAAASGASSTLAGGLLAIGAALVLTRSTRKARSCCM
jgi:nitrous oxidase accessory protein